MIYAILLITDCCLKSKHSKIVMITYSLFILSIECFQFLSGGAKEYFSNFWNYFDFSSPVLYIIYAIFELLDNEGDDDT